MFAAGSKEKPREFGRMGERLAGQLSVALAKQGDHKKQCGGKDERPN
jgi:hypothetical protein